MAIPRYEHFEKWDVYNNYRYYNDYDVGEQADANKV